MLDDLYGMIFKRKSFHLFRNLGDYHIDDKDLEDIINVYNKLDPLDINIKTKIRIVSSSDTTCKRGEEYCIQIFSETKDNYLQNIGYLCEQLDLYLVSKNIATLWYGIAKCKETYEGLSYVIMMAISKTESNNFRKDMFKTKRKNVEDIWDGDDYGVSNIVRFAPSACNSQPWFVSSEDNVLSVYRISKSGKVGIMPKNASIYYNQIDIGIFMCFLELCLNHNNIKYRRQLFIDNKSFDTKELNAEYYLEK